MAVLGSVGPLVLPVKSHVAGKNWMRKLRKKEWQPRSREQNQNQQPAARRSILTEPPLCASLLVGGRAEPSVGPGQPPQTAGVAGLATRCQLPSRVPSEEQREGVFAWLHCPSRSLRLTKQRSLPKLTESGRGSWVNGSQPGIPHPEPHPQRHGQSYHYSRHSSINISQTLNCITLSCCPFEFTPVYQVTGPGMWLRNHDTTHFHHFHHLTGAKLPDLLFGVKT